MKKSLFLVCFFSLCLSVFPEIPSSLSGIWESDDRILFISESGEFSIVLKLYNGWYFDRAAESPGFEDGSAKERNAASSRNPVVLNIDFYPVFQNHPEHENAENAADEEKPSAYEMILSDEKETVQIIPVAVSENKMHLSFLVKNNSGPEQEEKIGNMNENEIRGEVGNQGGNSSSLFGYWEGVNKAQEIRLSGTKKDGNIFSYIVLPDGIYEIRFWKTDMEYDRNGFASLTDGEKTFTVQKHIFSAGETFTSAPGRRTQIRNFRKSDSLPFEYSLDSSGKILLSGKADFVKSDESSKERLLEIVKEANSRRKPVPAPLFPESEIDFHWNLIDALEKDNKIIQEARERQREFGPRGKDRNR